MDVLTTMLAVLVAILVPAFLWGLRWWMGRRSLPPLPLPDDGGLIRHLDVSYVDGPKAHPVRHRLDVYAPAGAKKLPVLLFIHGGGWSFGHKSSPTLGMYEKTGETLASLGMIVVMANYRLSPWVQHPEHIKDVARAFAWTRKHIREHGGDPDAIILLGHSAGGHLASLLATDPCWTAEGDRKAIRGVVSTERG